MLKNAIDIIRPSIFQVNVQTFRSEFQYKKLPLTVPIGTAFAVSENGLLITALHVIVAAEGIISECGGNMSVAFAGPSVDTPAIKIHAAFTGTGFEVLSRDEDNDLALLKLTYNNLSEMIILVGPGEADAHPVACELDVKVPTDGEAIGISGYPLSEPSLVSTSGFIASNWTLNNHQDSYLGDITANGGNSGGPVYKLSDGKVIGVCVAGKLTRATHNMGDDAKILHSAGLTFITPALAVQNLIQGN